MGRTDLYGKATHAAQAEKLFGSLHEKFCCLATTFWFIPAHGAGSVCGHGISGREPTTVGYEKKTNPYLHLGREEFIQKVVGEELVVPRYFRRMEEFNLNGPPLLCEISYPKPLSLLEFEEEMQEQNMIVMDTRLPSMPSLAHISPIPSACGLAELASTPAGSSTPISTLSLSLNAPPTSTQLRRD